MGTVYLDYSGRTFIVTSTIAVSATQCKIAINLMSNTNVEGEAVVT